MDFLGNLVAEARDENVKNILNKFNTDMDHQTNMRNILGKEASACSIDGLKETLMYLNCSESNLEDFHKEYLVELILNKINQLCIQAPREISPRFLDNTSKDHTDIMKSHLDVDAQQLPAFSYKDSDKVENNDKKPNCKFFEANKCMFGIRGIGCKYNHPRVCRKIVKHGIGGPSGCDSECDKFHPKMCRSSLEKRECFKESCRLCHIKSTIRLSNNHKSKYNRLRENEAKEINGYRKYKRNSYQFDPSYNRQSHPMNQHHQDLNSRNKEKELIKLRRDVNEIQMVMRNLPNHVGKIVPLKGN